MTTLTSIAPGNPQSQATPLVPNGATSSGTSFSDILDAVNPFQHIPVVSSLYRAATGGTISTGAKLAGDTLYGVLFGGGAIGLATSVASSAADIAVTQATGKDISTNLVNAVSSPSTPSNAATPLVPDQGQAAIINTALENSNSNQVPQFFPMDKHPAVTAGEYQHAQIQDALEKKLLQIS